jgi:hypothetical protein
VIVCLGSLTQVPCIMGRARTDFIARMQEVNVYFDLIKILDQTNPVLHYEEEATSLPKQQPMSMDLIRILKSNAFLLLYNVMEACIKNCLNQVFDSIRAESLSYGDVAEKVRGIWAAQQMSRYREAKDENLKTRMKQVADNILAKALIDLNENITRISGNIDARAIKEFAEEYGFDSTVPDEIRGNCLKDIKDARNHLAHGDLTFIDRGKNLPVSTLVQYRADVEHYLDHVITNVDRYITDRKYAHP